MLLLSYAKAEVMEPDTLLLRYQLLRAAATLFSRKLKVSECYPAELVRDMRRLSAAIAVELLVICSVMARRAL